MYATPICATQSGYTPPLSIFNWSSPVIEQLCNISLSQAIFICVCMCMCVGVCVWVCTVVLARMVFCKIIKYISKTNVCVFTCGTSLIILLLSIHHFSCLRLISDDCSVGIRSNSISGDPSTRWANDWWHIWRCYNYMLIWDSLCKKIEIGLGSIGVHNVV